MSSPSNDKGKTKRHLHKPASFFTRVESDHKRSDWAFLILNRPVTSKAMLAHMMRSCGYRICADGGANHLYDCFVAPVKPYQAYLTYLQSYLPDVIHGDLDSIKDNVRRFYQEHGVRVTLDEDQNTTDFGKALKRIRDHRRKASRPRQASDPSGSQGSTPNTQNVLPPTSILVCGSLSGRVDQGLGLLSEIIREQTAFPDFAIYLIGECSFSFLLLPGENVIDFTGHLAASNSGNQNVPKLSRSVTAPPEGAPNRAQSWSLEPIIKKGIFTQNAGIIPIAGPAIITTKGFEWDVEDWETRMGGNISSSNHIKEGSVRIWTDQYVLFTIEMRDSHPAVKKQA